MAARADRLAADASVVEAEAGDPCLGQGLADGDDHVIIHVAAVQRMGVADGGSGEGSGDRLVEDAFQG